jgi:hypothetical protein
MPTATLANSATAAYGGDLAYYYGLNGTLTGLDLSDADATLQSTSFGSGLQTINAGGVTGGPVVLAVPATVHAEAVAAPRQSGTTSPEQVGATTATAVAAVEQSPAGKNHSLLDSTWRFGVGRLPPGTVEPVPVEPVPGNGFGGGNGSWHPWHGFPHLPPIVANPITCATQPTGRQGSGSAAHVLAEGGAAAHSARNALAVPLSVLPAQNGEVANSSSESFDQPLDPASATSTAPAPAGNATQEAVAASAPLNPSTTGISLPVITPPVFGQNTGTGSSSGGSSTGGSSGQTTQGGSSDPGLASLIQSLLDQSAAAAPSGGGGTPFTGTLYSGGGTPAMGLSDILGGDDSNGFVTSDALRSAAKDDGSQRSDAGLFPDFDALQGKSNASQWSLANDASADSQRSLRVAKAGTGAEDEFAEDAGALDFMPSSIHHRMMQHKAQTSIEQSRHSSVA